MKEELWKVIPFESNYEVSTLGRVRNASTTQVKSLRLDKYGYLRVTLYPSGKTYSIHRLVGEVWLTKAEESLQINHKDFNKTNNHVNNLEWCSVRENCIHREKFLDKERISGDRNPMARYSVEDVLNIRKLYDQGVGYMDIARMYKAPDEPIRRIVKRESWKHI